MTMEIKQTKKGSEGQIVIITLLLLGTFAAIAASVITQVVFEQKKAILEEKTQKAYYAAESGIENALKQIQTSATNELTDTELTIGEGGTSKSALVSLSKNNEGESATFVVPTVLNSGEPFNVNLVGYTGTAITVCWDKAGTSVNSTLLYTVSNVAKHAFYAGNSTAGQSPKIGNVTTASAISGSKCGLSSGYYVDFTLPGSATPVYMTIWPHYQEKVQFGFEGSVGADLPKQGVTITSQAQVTELSSKVTRSVRYFQSLTSYLPDYLFSGLYAGGGVVYGPGKNW